MLNVEISDVNEVSVVAPNGRIDSANANELGAALDEVIGAGNVNIVLDLTDVGYMSSAGLREMVSALKRVRRESGDVRLVQPSDRVREVLAMSGLDSIFQIFSTLDEAVASFQ